MTVVGLLHFHKLSQHLRHMRPPFKLHAKVRYCHDCISVAHCLVATLYLLVRSEVRVRILPAAFEVENAEAMEDRLAFFGIEYTKVVIPGTDAFQLFFFDPEG